MRIFLFFSILCFFSGLLLADSLLNSDQVIYNAGLFHFYMAMGFSIGLIVLLAVKRFLSQFLPTVAAINKEPISSAIFHGLSDLGVALCFGLICLGLML